MNTDDRIKHCINWLGGALVEHMGIWTTAQEELPYSREEWLELDKLPPSEEELFDVIRNCPWGPQDPITKEQMFADMQKIRTRGLR